MAEFLGIRHHGLAKLANRRTEVERLALRTRGIIGRSGAAQKVTAKIQAAANRRLGQRRPHRLPFKDQRNGPPHALIHDFDLNRLVFPMLSGCCDRVNFSWFDP